MNADQVIYRFKKLFFEKISEDDSLDPLDYAVAGGAVRDSLVGVKFKDIDVFCSGPDAVERLESWFSKQENVRILNGNDVLSNYMLNGNWFQIVKRAFFDRKYPKDLVERFDYTICGAMIHNGELITLPTFFQDSLTKRLRVNTLEFPLNSLERMQKYVKKGYTACNGTILSLAKAIQGLDLEKPGSNSLVFYPDGTPRFLGVD